ncbi:hypothetical protein HDR63_00435 [bacterium]|nr:hypothetical protein [bacterium]
MLYALQCYLTDYCNLNCPGCYRRAMAPNGAPDKLLPPSDIIHYVNAIRGNDKFEQAVVFSGGEIFTAPVPYLHEVIQATLDMDVAVQLKTNGSWVADARRAPAIWDMLKSLRVPRGLVATPEQVQECLRTMGGDAVRAARKDGAWYQALCDRLPTRPMLDLAVSVDNKIHPAQSVDWMRAIAERLAGDATLRDNISLKISAFMDNRNWFNRTVIRQGWPHVRDETWVNGQIMAFTYDGMPVYAFFSDFVDVPTIPVPVTDHVVFAGHDGEYLTPLYMHPNRTISFENVDTMHAVGRVSYVDAAGQCRPIKRVMKDMIKTLRAQVRGGR